MNNQPTSKSPEYLSQEEYVNRHNKLLDLIELGIDPYPHKYSSTEEIKDIVEEYQEVLDIGNSEKAISKETPLVSTYGRIMLMRYMGKNAFLNIKTGIDSIQIMFSKNFTKLNGLAEDSEVNALKILEKKVDLGDLIGVQGFLFRTQKGELTILVEEVTILCKSLLPIPDKHAKLVNKETRYRKRWLDMMSSEQVTDVFIKRSKILFLIRKFFNERKFIEVETPIIQNNYGGAEADPFVSHINAIDQDAFLRISLEISLKKLVVGGLSRVFEIGKVFRNEGIDRTHNPEFTMIETYASLWDYNDMMKVMEDLFEQLALAINGTTIVSYEIEEGNTVSVDVKAPWKRISMIESIVEYTGIQVESLSNEQLFQIALEKCSIESTAVLSRGELIAVLFDELVSDRLMEPHHIIDHPIETTPLCKLHRDSKLKQQGIVERFESFIFGKELCNAYTELNDPILQRKLFEEQANKKDNTQEIDEEFLEAIAQGMAPCGGLGIGIDRLVMFLTGAPSIRDVIFFPMMKKQQE